MQCIDVLALSIVSPTRPLSLSLSLCGYVMYWKHIAVRGTNKKQRLLARVLLPQVRLMISSALLYYL